MGYYTNFNIKVINEVDHDLDNIKEIIEEESGYDFEIHDNEICSNGEIKWYGYGTDMVKVSKQLPEVTFQVDGHGEESGDIWRNYWKDGKVQEAKRVVTIEPFDENKLKKW